MFSDIMELLEQTGYAKHTLWGNMYGASKSVVSFYQEKGADDYDTEIIIQDASIPKENPYWDYIKMNLIDVKFDELLKINSN